MDAGGEGLSAGLASCSFRDGYLGLYLLALFLEGDLDPAVIGLKTGLEPFQVTHLGFDLKLLITRLQRINSSQLADH